MRWWPGGGRTFASVCLARRLWRASGLPTPRCYGAIASPLFEPPRPSLPASVLPPRALARPFIRVRSLPVSIVVVGGGGDVIQSGNGRWLLGARAENDLAAATWLHFLRK